MKISTTDGERLHDFVVANVSDLGSLEGRFAMLMTVGGRATALGKYFGGVVALSVTTRLIRAARALLERYSANPKALASELVMFATDKVGLHGENCTDFEKLIELATLAAEAASQKKISHGLRAQLQQDGVDPCCYLCGKSLVFPDVEDIPTCDRCNKPYPDSGADEQVTWEHVWPRAYGGNTTVANLLPACRWCNDAKQSMVSWHWARIPATLLPHALGNGSISKEDAKQLQRAEKIALSMRAAWDLSVQKGVSLKEAHRELGGWTDPWAEDASDSNDFFNLRNNDISRFGLAWATN